MDELLLLLYLLILISTIPIVAMIRRRLNKFPSSSSLPLTLINDFDDCTIEDDIIRKEQQTSTVSHIVKLTEYFRQSQEDQLIKEIELSDCSNYKPPANRSFDMLGMMEEREITGHLQTIEEGRNTNPTENSSSSQVFTGTVGSIYVSAPVNNQT